MLKNYSGVPEYLEIQKINSLKNWIKNYVEIFFFLKNLKKNYGLSCVSYDLKQMLKNVQGFSNFSFILNKSWANFISHNLFWLA